MAVKKSVKIFIASAAAVALVIGLSVGITEKQKRQSMSASNAMAYSEYDCVESTSTTTMGGSSKSGKSGSKGGSSKSSKSDGRRLVVPGTEDYVRARERAGGRRSLQAEHVRTRGELG